MEVKHRWHNRQSQRYYEVKLFEDLLGDLVVFKYWGGIGQPTGGSENIFVKSITEGKKLITDLKKIRNQRGYYKLY